MNHVIQINNNRYVIRHQHQKITLLNFPQLHLIYKYYINASFSYVNQNTREVLVINQNQINILQPVITPLQLASVQQSFIDWQPSGGILMQNNIVLYGSHEIVFYTRSNIMEKTWQIEVLQEIEQIKSNKCDQTIAMKVKQPKNTLFLWRLSEPTVKPTQQIILTRPILQWNFVRQDLLAILTSTQLRIYIQGSQNFFNLYHFHLVTASSFCWINHQWIPKQNRISVNSVILMGRKGSATVMQLFGLEKRVLQSQMKEIGKIQLKYKSVNMKKVIEAWGFEDKIGLICQTKNHQLFSFDIDRNLSIQRVKAYQECLGAQINQVYMSNGLVLAKDRTRWKYYKVNEIGGFVLSQELDCEKAFIWSEKQIAYVYEQAIYTKQIKGERRDPIPFKYPDSSKLHRIYSDDDSCFIVAGIRFFKIFQGSVSSAGFALKNEKAEFISVDIQSKKLTYKVNDQFVILTYVISGNKITTSTIKSSSKQIISVQGTRWIELSQLDFSLGQGDKIITVFPLSKLLKILDSQNKIFNYSIHSLHGEALVLIIKNYAFFLQIVENQKTCQIILIKRMNTVLYHRFNPQAQILKLVQSKTLTFWVDNTLITLGNRINTHAIADPYIPPQTLMSKQLQNKKLFPPHHPRIIQLLIQTNNFNLVLQIFKKVRNWFNQPNHTLSTLYQLINIQFISDVLWKTGQQNLSRWPVQRIQEQKESISKFASQILDNIQGIQLRQKAPFILQSLLESFAYYLQHSKIVDIFSQSTLILSKTSILKEKPLSSMHVAHLLHSLNKEEAAQQLKPEKMSWQWLRDKSIPFWIQSKDSLKKWIQEIAAQQYRNKKDPFDCLFWYLLVGKRTLLATLFKNHSLDSKEHDSIAKFLLRDFNQAKDRSAAVKNAYVLIDKKRYLHALSFFILGGSMDDCIRLCIDRLKDLNLAYTFILLFKEVSNAYFLNQLSKGDVWMKHISFKLSNKHILSYNCLFENNDITMWEFIPELTGFHPSLLEFTEKIRNSIPVKREIEAQKQANFQSDDIFSDFYDDGPSVKQQKKKDIIQVKGDIDDLKPLATKYYIREGVPILALSLQESNSQAKEAYSLQLYKLSGQVNPIMEPVLFALEDKLSIVKCLVQKKCFKQISRYLKIQNEKFKQYLAQISLVEVIQTKKHIVGEILHFGYFSQKIALLDFKDAQITEGKEFFQIISEVGKLSKIAKILSCLILQFYQDLFDLLQDLKLQKIMQTPQIWGKLKEQYDGLVEFKKLKQLKHMDHFQHAFTSIYRPNKNQAAYHSQLQFSSDQGALLIVRICVFNYLIKQNLSIQPILTKIKINIQMFYKNWFSIYKQNQLQGQFKILLKQGTQAKLKLPLLNKVFDNHFTQIYDIIALTHAGYFQQLSFSQIEDKPKQLQAVQVFKSRQDGVRSFIINTQEGKGLECIVLFKKIFKKVEICESLAKRERTKDGYGLLIDDSGYTNISNADLSPYLKAKHSPCINEALQNIMNVTKNINNKFPRSTALISQKDYLRPVEAPYLDYNELNSLECHPFLPFFMIGGKGLIEVAHLSTLKNFNRIKCPGMSQIVKLHSCGQRVGGVDSNGSLSLYHFDPAFQNNCVYSLKKTSIIDFCYLNPSVLAVISASQIQVFDTLINPKRQLKFKQPFTKDPLLISSIGPNRVAVLRKNEVLLYDIRNQKLESSKQLKGKGKSMIVQGNNLYVGQTDSKIRVFNINSTTDTSEVIKVGFGDEKQREKYSIDQLMNYENIVLALSSQGSIYYLPKIIKPIV